MFSIIFVCIYFLLGLWVSKRHWLSTKKLADPYITFIFIACMWPIVYAGEKGWLD